MRSLTAADFNRATVLWLDEQYTAGMVAEALECDVSEIYDFLVLLSATTPPKKPQ